MTKEFKERMLNIRCAWCGALPGAACTSKFGREVKPHSRRFYAAKSQERREQQPSQRTGD